MFNQATYNQIKDNLAEAVAKLQARTERYEAAMKKYEDYTKAETPWRDKLFASLSPDSVGEAVGFNWYVLLFAFPIACCMYGWGYILIIILGGDITTTSTSSQDFMVLMQDFIRNLPLMLSILLAVGFFVLMCALSMTMVYFWSAQFFAKKGKAKKALKAEYLTQEEYAELLCPFEINRNCCRKGAHREIEKIFKDEVRPAYQAFKSFCSRNPHKSIDDEVSKIRQAWRELKVYVTVFYLHKKTGKMYAKAVAMSATSTLKFLGVVVGGVVVVGLAGVALTFKGMKGSGGSGGESKSTDCPYCHLPRPPIGSCPNCGH